MNSLTCEPEQDLFRFASEDFSPMKRQAEGITKKARLNEPGFFMNSFFLIRA